MFDGMTEVRLFKDDETKVKIEHKVFSVVQFDQNFPFISSVIFSKC